MSHIGSNSDSSDFRAPLPPPSSLSAASLIKSIRASKFTSESTPSVASNNGSQAPRKSKFSDLPQAASVPPPGVVAPPPKVDAVAAAAAAAARINASLKAKGKLSDQTLLKPIVNSSGVTTPLSIIKVSETKKVFNSYIAKIDINNLPLSARTYLTQVGVQENVNKETGAAVSTKGQYLLADETKPLDSIEKQLHLFIQSPFKEKTDLAVAKLKEIISKQKLPPPIPGANPTPNLPPVKPIPPGQPTLPTGNFVQEKVFVGMDYCVPEFDLKTKLIGMNYANFNFVANATGAKVILRGKGSGFIEPTSGREAFESMYVFVSHPNQAGVDAAKKLVYNLISTVNSEYNSYRAKKCAASSSTFSTSTTTFPQYPPPIPTPPNPYGAIPPPSSTYVPNPYSTPPPIIPPPNPYNVPPPGANNFYPPPVPNPYTASIPPTTTSFSMPPPKPVNPVPAPHLPPPEPSNKDSKQSQYNNIPEPKTKKRRFQEEQPDDSNVLGYKQYSYADNNDDTKKSKKKSSSKNSAKLNEQKETTNMPFWMSHD